MDLIEDIGPILGIVAFLGFAILALLIVLQAREVRRLREWAGRAPERALEADDATLAAAEERDDSEPGRLADLRERAGGSLRDGWAALDRNFPVDPRWLLGIIAAAVIAAAVVTSGFGLVGDEDGGGGERGGKGSRDMPAAVAVLNATQVDDVVPPVEAVSGLAGTVAQQVVEPAGFRVVEQGDAAAGAESSVVMFVPGAEDDADRLAAQVAGDLGETGVEPMSAEVRDRVGEAQLALVIGQDDANFGDVDTDTTVVP